jgi:hypothetical protein
MSGKTTGLTALEMRRQLLVVESELNRAHLLNECREVRKGINHLTGQIGVLAQLTESAVNIGTSFAGFFRGMSGGKKPEEGRKPSWIATLLEGARAGISLWTTITSSKR